VHDLELESAEPAHLRAGLQVSVLSIAWTTSASIAAVVLGVSAGSLVLVAFGLTGILDAAGSAALVVHFRHALHHEVLSERHERLALRVVTLGLFVVGSLTAAESGRRLVVHPTSHTVPAGVAVAAISIVVLALLSTRKRRIARRIPSRALLADGWLSATGCLLAVVTVAGTGLSSSFGWWWADPVAAAVVAGGAVGVAVVMARG
jgi:divalent metal cation (Fe/Co/Zn/Cd) transporter